MSRRTHAPVVVACAGVLCGILDAVSAIVLFGITLVQSFRGITRGMLGRAALTGRDFAVALGTAAHFSVAPGAALLPEPRMAPPCTSS